MAEYIVLTSLTPDGRRRVHQDPDRVRQVAREVERLGGKVMAQYAVLGPHDFLSVIEATDNADMERIKAEISSLGTTRSLVLPAIGLAKFARLLSIEPYRTEPHRWQTSPWARIVRRAGRYWVIDRHVRRYCHPLHIEGRERLAHVRGGAIIIANHSSHFDTPVVLSALPGRIRAKTAVAAAADKFYASRRKRTWWYSLFHNTFPVHRGGGTKQLAYPLSLLHSGWSILIYPEGGRSKSGQVQKFKHGPAIMAMQAGVPVIPVYIEGLRAVMPKGQREPRPAPVSARIGSPISLAGVTSLPEATAMLENAMREIAGVPAHRPHAPEGEFAIASPSTAGGGGS
ncbi:MAG TPA: GYD domain-containing protein [Dehalococcoidia bacterium]|nr:GYD domain-containing protein [Dehalococcoidia bacterium]